MKCLNVPCGRVMIAALLCAAALSCGPSVSVKPLRLSDPSLSPNARRFLADTEDAALIGTEDLCSEDELAELAHA